MEEITIAVLGSNPVRLDWGSSTGIQSLESVSFESIMHHRGHFHWIGGVFTEDDVIRLRDWFADAARLIEKRGVLGQLNTPSVAAKHFHELRCLAPIACWCPCCNERGSLST